MAARPRPVPTVFQMEAAECGAACLAMVLAHHGKWAPLPELREACGVSRDGSRASNIVRAARAYGLEAKGFRCEPHHLADIAMPCIVFVDLSHYVVLEGMTGGRVQLNDPAAGRRVLTAAEFDALFSGIVLTFQTGADFRRSGTAPSTWRDIAALVAGTHGPLALAMLAGVALILPGLVVPAATQVFVDYYLVQGQADWGVPLLGVLLATAVVQWGLTGLQNSLLVRLHTRIAILAAGRVVWRMLRLPVRFFGQRHAGALAGRVDLARPLGLQAAEQPVKAALALASSVFFTLAMLLYSPILTLVTLLAAAIPIAALALTQRRLEERVRKAGMAAIKVHGRAIQGIGMVETLKASGTDDVFFGQWAGLLAALVRDRQAAGRIEALLGAVPDGVMLLNRGLVLALSAGFVIAGSMTVGELAAFQTLITAFAATLSTLMRQITSLKQVRSPLDQLADVATTPLAWEFAGDRPDAPAAPAIRGGAKLSGALAVRDLTFGYTSQGAMVVNGVDLDIAPGARVALVGASGSGKSAVGRLVAGLFDPLGGTILLDGHPLRVVPRDRLRALLAMVDQDILLFEGTVRDNLTLWDEAVPEARIIRAAKDAMIHDDIVARVGGYGGRVEEAGRNWSGGQRQRLEIARALVMEPSLLILDEATSALDPTVEQALMDNVRRRGCACLIIAHRLSAIRDCDEIIVLKDGRVLERGGHEALMTAGGAYRQLVES
ncbi:MULTISPECIES: NHLP family bacteriocin export ABC transporter peptidase/permease/ATPase subunit [Nitrospirillum]|uniref:NHLM bacteriocin system ABC transporter peptidase/ATP-binding protein n=1 Tax=Nitrospirillum amazonense TaxID=28077 RepID=A0A560GEI8_9PROT|nr:NHLP family bacteriocin export ABC transporter peptidase/permease/ATPase subunit [Nitrospirillum amazonense]MEC4590944.1 NHLP family bacteriocin export ABC transporter peptidase/permease/ATPase subunit [Nitrospirillum amazonense]TWB32144.1 NHLM bacteriocin system ABC transporter peptidase/ATP-binding protein [Nitrospirillum amazonense]